MGARWHPDCFPVSVLQGANFTENDYFSVKLGPSGVHRLRSMGSRDGPHSAARDGPRTVALPTPTTGVLRRDADGMCNLMSLYLIAIKQRSPANGALQGEPCHTFWKTTRAVLLRPIAVLYSIKNPMTGSVEISAPFVWTRFHFLPNISMFSV